MITLHCILIFIIFLSIDFSSAPFSVDQVKRFMEYMKQKYRSVMKDEEHTKVLIFCSLIYLFTFIIMLVD